MEVLIIACAPATTSLSKMLETKKKVDLVFDQGYIQYAKVITNVTHGLHD